MSVPIRNNVYVISIAIQMHGTVISFDLGPSEATAFENVRLLCKAGGFNPHYQFSTYVANDLQKIFAKDMTDRSTYDIIKAAKSGLTLDNITFDKTLSKYTSARNMFDRWNGIYLLSIHRERELIYPLSREEEVINFLNVEDLRRLSSMFSSPVPDLAKVSSPFPDKSKFIEEEAKISSDTSLLEEVKKRQIKELRGEFMSLLGDWKLTLERNGNIDIIKLSYLVKVIKDIIKFGEKDKIIINLLDYSCNVPTQYIPEEERHLSKYVFQNVGNDIAAMESGYGELGDRRYGGVRRRKNRVKKKTMRRNRVVRRKRRTIRGFKSL